MTAPGDVLALLRTRNYLVLLVFAGVLGVPIAAVAYWFLYLVADLQKWIYQPALPSEVAGLSWDADLVAGPGGRRGRHPGRPDHPLSARAGTGIRRPTDSTPEGHLRRSELPGVALAALATLALGVVLGPEAPLIAIGGGLATLAVRLAKRDAPPQTLAVGSAGPEASPR